MNNFNRDLLVLAVVVSAVIAIGGCSGRAIVPTSFNTYNSKDGAFKIDYPAQWQAEGNSKSGYAWAKFASGSAEITIDANVVGSLIAEIARTRSQMHGIQNTDPENAPVAVVHENERQGFEEDGSVQEQEPLPINTGFGDSRKSEYAGRRTFGGSIHGYRVTALSPEKRIRVVCQCSESEWESLKPAFDKAIKSVAMGEVDPVV